MSQSATTKMEMDGLKKRLVELKDELRDLKASHDELERRVADIDRKYHQMLHRLNVVESGPIVGAVEKDVSEEHKNLLARVHDDLGRLKYRVRQLEEK